MARLPDPRPFLDADARTEMQRITAARRDAEGRADVSAVYVAMFNNPAVASSVAALGELLRFHGTLPDQIREIAILRYAARNNLAYEWAHHQRPAKLAGISPEMIDALGAGALPDELNGVQRATVQAVDQIANGEEIAEAIQQVLADAVGYAGLVELAALCGLYALIGYMTTAFAIPVEADLVPSEGRPPPNDDGE
jgi:4-carboxymuconolactone decarboxylase